MGSVAKKSRLQPYQPFSLRKHAGRCLSLQLNWIFSLMLFLSKCILDIFYRWVLPRGSDWSLPDNIPCDDINNEKWKPIAKRFSLMSSSQQAECYARIDRFVAANGKEVLCRCCSLEDSMSPELHSAWSALVEPMIIQIAQTSNAKDKLLMNSMITKGEGGDFKVISWQYVQRSCYKEGELK